MIANPYAQLFTLALYAFLPLSFMDQVQAAGLAESFGALFIILFLSAYGSVFFFIGYILMLLKKEKGQIRPLIPKILLADAAPDEYQDSGVYYYYWLD